MIDVENFSAELKSDLRLSLIVTQTIMFRKLENLSVKKGVITEKEYKELVTSTVDDIKRVWSETDGTRTAKTR